MTYKLKNYYSPSLYLHEDLEISIFAQPTRPNNLSPTSVMIKDFYGCVYCTKTGTRRTMNAHFERVRRESDEYHSNELIQNNNKLITKVVFKVTFHILNKVLEMA